MANPSNTTGLKGNVTRAEAHVPIGLAAVACTRRMLPESHGATERLDLAGVTLVTAGVVAIVWALVLASDTGWSSPQVVAALLAGAVLLAAFVARESRAAEPLVPLRLFRNRAFAVGNVTMFFMSGAIFSAAFLILQELQFARGYSPVAAGARLLPLFATPMLISPLAGAASDRIGRRPVMITGLTLQTLGFTWVAARGSLATSWIELMLALLVSGFRPALWSCVVFAALAAVTAAGITAAPRRASTETPAADLPVAA